MPHQPVLGSRSVPIVEVGGLRFRDLNRDGRLTPYEDWRLSPEQRAADLVSRMTLEEKASAMMHPVMGKPDQVTVSGINSVLSRSKKAPTELAAENNAFQEAAERTRLAIPVTISTDPRNGFGGAFGTSVEANGFTQWPDEPGLAATGDTALVRRLADVARQEYRAVGFTMALSPQADIATDPRWSRTSGTFGDDSETVGHMAAAYVEGMQGGANGVTSRGVAAVVKHYAGYGAVKDGWDSHSHYGRFATFPGGQFKRHLSVFRPPFRAKVAGVMPTYSILDLPGMPPVGAGFNKTLLTDILRRGEGFDGLVLSDWSITEDCIGPCLGKPFTGSRKGILGKPWGVENLPRADRVIRTIEAGVDQIGLDAGDDEVDSSPIVGAVRSGKLSQERIDQAVLRIAVIKFETGLFENPYVDAARAAHLVGQAAFRQIAFEAQRRSLVLFKNKGHLLPVKAISKRVFLRGINAEVARQAGFTVVDRLDHADLAIIRAVAPRQLVHPNYVFGRLQHEGDLDFKSDNEDLGAIRNAAAAGVPAIVTVYLERPAILTNVRDLATALIGNFGVSDQALFDLITGRANPEGKLPFELPSSMDAVRTQLPDVPHDSANPLFRSGYGLTY